MKVAARRNLLLGRCDKFKQGVFLRALRNHDPAGAGGHERLGDRLREAIMKRPKRAVEDTSRLRTIKVNDRAAPRKMQDSVNLSGAQRRRGRVGQALGSNRAIDHDGLDPHAVRRNRYGEVAGAILPNQVKYLFTSCHSVANELRERLLVAVGRGDVGEAYGPRRLGGAAADRQRWQPSQFQAA